MSTPQKPVRRPARVKSVASGGAPPVLTGKESIFLSAYRAMDDDTREDAIAMMQILARRFPRSPRLRLVAGTVAQATLRFGN